MFDFCDKKCRFAFSVSQQKVAHFNISRQKVPYFNISLSHSLSISSHFLSLPPLSRHAVPTCQQFVLPWLLHILCSGAGARTHPFSHYYIHKDTPTFSFSQHTRPIQPHTMIKRKKANCRYISPRSPIFPLTLGDSPLQPGTTTKK